MFWADTWQEPTLSWQGRLLALYCVYEWSFKMDESSQLAKNPYETSRFPVLYIILYLVFFLAQVQWYCMIIQFSTWFNLKTISKHEQRLASTNICSFCAVGFFLSALSPSTYTHLPSVQSDPILFRPLSYVLANKILYPWSTPPLRFEWILQGQVIALERLYFETTTLI